jgi:hypothetical protein
VHFILSFFIVWGSCKISWCNQQIHVTGTHHSWYLLDNRGFTVFTLPVTLLSILIILRKWTLMSIILSHIRKQCQHSYVVGTTDILKMKD